MRFYSEILPINIYIINEFLPCESNKKSKCERFSIIP